MKRQSDDFMAQLKKKDDEIFAEKKFHQSFSKRKEEEIRAASEEYQVQLKKREDEI
jgi:hypothetical protein